MAEDDDDGEGLLGFKLQFAVCLGFEFPGSDSVVGTENFQLWKFQQRHQDPNVTFPLHICFIFILS